MSCVERVVADVSIRSNFSNFRWLSCYTGHDRPSSLVYNVGSGRPQTRIGRPRGSPCLCLSLLLYCHRLCQVSWLIDVAATSDGGVVGEELQGYDGQQRTEHL